VVIGTLESLAKAPPASPTVAPSRTGSTASGADAARVQTLEAQVQSLTAQVQQMSNDLRAQRGGDRRSEFPAGTLPQTAAAPVAPSAGTVSSFGSTTVTSATGSSDAIGGLLSAEPPPVKVGEALPDVAGTLAPGPAAPGQMASLVPGDGADPQQLYSSAYGYLLGQNYGAAQSGFEEFLRKHPRDALAPDALFWLGESHYMQKNYGDAAEAFDLVTASYGSSTKAPEAQLRRAASLVQLGRKDDACAALRQLNTKYPNARPVLKTKAEAERQRAGCT
jgi:tol-pal system protein YbgF